MLLACRLSGSSRLEPRQRGSFCQRPKSLPWDPYRLRPTPCPAPDAARGPCGQLLHGRGGGIDIVHVDVGMRPSLGRLHVGDCPAHLVTDLGCVVLERAGMPSNCHPRASPNTHAPWRCRPPESQMHQLTGHSPPIANSLISLDVRRRPSTCAACDHRTSADRNGFGVAESWPVRLGASAFCLGSTPCPRSS